MVAKTHDVLQQPFLVDLRAGVANLHAAPVGLAGHQAVAFEQVAGQHLGHRGFVKLGFEQIGRRLVAGAFHVQAVQAQAVQFVHGFLVKQLGCNQLDPHRGGVGRAAPHGFADVGTQAGLHLAGIAKAGVVEAVEVELERLALNDVGRLARDGEVHQRHLGLAAQVEPRHLKRRPQIGPEKGRNIGNADLGPLARAWDGKEQRRVVLVRVGRGFAQLGLFRGIGHLL